MWSKTVQGSVKYQYNVRLNANDTFFIITFIPESVQSALWILKFGRKQLHSWVSWMIVAQVQLSQMGGVGAQSWGQRGTAFLCDLTAWQPADGTI